MKESGCLKGNIEDIAVFKECLEKAWAALDQDY
jgi:hypothetical protein